MRPTRAVIHLNAIQHNLRAIATALPGTPEICAAVKANAYGHGAVQVSRALLEAGAQQLGVAVPDEGCELRRAGISSEILLFSPFFPEEAATIVANRLVPMVFDRGRIDALGQAAARLAIPASVYLKIDTGMGRVGCRPEQATELAAAIQEHPHLELRGLATHFAASDGADTSFATQQLQLFVQIATAIREHGIDPGVLSAANSGAVITMPDSATLQLARPGIMLYGSYPSHDVTRELGLVPAMTFESAVGFIKRVPTGTPISYGMTHTTTRETEIATIPVGYADGVFRILSNRGRIWINGRNYPIAGRICMDQLMVDLGPDSGVRLYDRAVLFGPPQPRPLSDQHAGATAEWPEQPPTPEEVADLCGTIPYEITCAVSSRIPRVYQP